MISNIDGVKCFLSREIKNEMIDELVIRLVSIPDVMGAGILGKDGFVLSWQSKDCAEPKKYLNELSNYTSAFHQKNLYPRRNGMFTYTLYNYNGNKILFRGIDDNLLLMLVLDKKALIGVTMLDIEGCLLYIDLAMEESYKRFYDSPA